MGSRAELFTTGRARSSLCHGGEARACATPLGSGADGDRGGCRGIRSRWRRVSPGNLRGPRGAWSGIGWSRVGAWCIPQFLDHNSRRDSVGRCPFFCRRLSEPEFRCATGLFPVESRAGACRRSAGGARDRASGLLAAPTRSRRDSRPMSWEDKMTVLAAGASQGQDQQDRRASTVTSSRPGSPPGGQPRRVWRGFKPAARAAVARRPATHPINHSGSPVGLQARRGARGWAVTRGTVPQAERTLGSAAVAFTWRRGPSRGPRSVGGGRW